MKKSMKPDNNNLDAIAAQARKPLPKAGLGLGFFKGMKDGMTNKFTAAGKLAGGDPMGAMTQQTGMTPDQLVGTAMKVAPMMLKKGGMAKKKKC